MISSKTTSKDQLGGQHRPVTVISLDHFTGVERLNPGEPTEISPGVTISVLQTAAEGLLEIDSSIESKAEVNGKRALELATVQVGQIIKTSHGRFVLVRHLDSFVVPRDPGYRRPEYILNAIALAQATIADIEPLSATNILPKGSKFVGSMAASSSNLLIEGSGRKVVVRSLIGIFAVIIAIMLLYSLGHDAVADQRLDSAASKATKVAKSTIVSTRDSSGIDVPVADKASGMTKAPIVATPGHTGSAGLGVSQKNSVPSPIRPVSASVMDRAGHRDGNSPGVTSVRSIQLSEKDRQTIVEYRLEARFDRSSARAKLSHMAKSFPVGSPARTEVERAYSGL